MHLQPVFAGAAVVGGSISNDIYARGLSAQRFSAYRSPASAVVRALLELAGLRR